MEKILIANYPEIDYAVVYLPTNSLTPFVCAWSPTFVDDELDHWGQGHYFGRLEDAVDYIKEKKAKKGGNI